MRDVTDPHKKVSGKGYYRCASQCHWARMCPQRKPTETPGKPATSSVVMTTEKESMSERCERFRKELMMAEHQKMMNHYGESCGGVMVSESVGPLYYATVMVEGVSTEAMVGHGSSATVISYDRFEVIGKHTGKPVEAMMSRYYHAGL